MCVVFIIFYIYIYLFKDYFSANPVGFQFFTIVSINYDIFSLFTLLVEATMHTKTLCVIFLLCQSYLYC